MYIFCNTVYSSKADTLFTVQICLPDYKLNTNNVQLKQNNLFNRSLIHFQKQYELLSIKKTL